MHEFVQEVWYSVSLGACNRLDLDPLGELIDGHQQAKGQVGGMVTSL
jgi:hypothetical protein